MMTTWDALVWELVSLGIWRGIRCGIYVALCFAKVGEGEGFGVSGEQNEMGLAPGLLGRQCHGHEQYESRVGRQIEVIPESLPVVVQYDGSVAGGERKGSHATIDVLRLIDAQKE